jgi:hypothetical protein
MFCTQCGTPFEPGQNFCKQCGARVNKQEPDLIRSVETSKRNAIHTAPVSAATRDARPHPQSRERKEVSLTVLVGVCLTVIESDSSAAVNENLSSPQHSPEAQTSSPPAPRSSQPQAETSPKAEKKEGMELARKSQSQREGQDGQSSGPSATKPTAAARRSAAAGTYQTTRSTTVFESASSSSQVVANIPGGTRLDVVNTKGEWLEVHSRRGNPPGFIRREDAALIEKTE